MALLSLTALATTVGAAVVVYYLALAIYRLYFHPLTKFPGPKLAALSRWYEFYYDVYKRGHFIWKIQELHARYGPIIRINPEEIHLNDPEYYDEIYGSATRKRDKYGPWVALSGAPGSIFSTVVHDHHRLRRSALNPFFSKKAVAEMEPVIQEKIERLAGRFKKALKTGEVIRSDAAYTALTMDVICRYAFAADDDMLTKDDFNYVWKETLIGAFEGGLLLRQFPWMLPLTNALPQTFLEKVNPNMKLMLDWKEGVRERVKPIVNRTETASDIEKASHRSIFHELRDSSLPPEEKTIDRLCDEGQVFTGAGSETTAQTLATTTFYLLDNKEKLMKLKKELLIAIPNANEVTSSSKLEQLPYLSAVLAEGLRLSHGATTRLPRVAVDEVLKYKEWEIPFGTPVSATAYFVLMNPTIFPEPDRFLPERWLLDNSSEYNHALHRRYLVNFGRGSRQCVGMNLAYTELYLALATIIRRFDLQLYETTLDDVRMVHDFFTATPKLDTKGVRVIVTGESN